MPQIIASAVKPRAFVRFSSSQKRHAVTKADQSFVAPISPPPSILASQPDVLLLLADDLGWANVGWHRPADGSWKEVVTPAMDALVKEGIELNRAYAYHMCSPSRSSLQSGRLPLHVNVVNADPTIYDASSASGTGAGIPRNMTTIASKMRSAGYRTVMAGKWDAGMATPTHTPHGRGYDDSICYFHHGNSYWKEETGDLTCDIMVDLWDNEKPAWGQQGIAGSEPSYNDSNYEEHVFRERLLHQLAEHDASKAPLFMFYSAHLVHDPYEVPQNYLDAKSKAGGGAFNNATAQDEMRMTYSAMVSYLDDNINAITTAWKAKDGGAMWENTLVLFFADNGGPIYAGGNNYPMRGGKYSEFEGGVRVASFASGGLIPTSKRGTVSNGLFAIADVYVTLCGVAGVDPVDKAAEAAGLPPVDGLDISPMLIDPKVGVSESPRKEVQLMPLSPDIINELAAYDAMLAVWEELQTSSTLSASTWDVYPNATCKNSNANKIDFVHHIATLEACEAACAANAKCMQFQWKRVIPSTGGDHWCALYAPASPAHITKGGADDYACGCRGQCPSAPAPGPSPGPPKVPTCWKVQDCELGGTTIATHKDMLLNDCCKACDATNGTCNAAVFVPDPKYPTSTAATAVYSLEDDMAYLDAQLSISSLSRRAPAPREAGAVAEATGTCYFKSDTRNQTMVKKSVCWLPSKLHPPPLKIIDMQAGFILGDLKIVTGNDVNMAIWQGPAYPNATTPYNNSVKVPGYACSNPYRRACLFNVSADPTEHNDLSASQPDDLKRMLNLLVNRSASFFKPERGPGQNASCAIGEGAYKGPRGQGFFGPWLELPF